MAIDKDDSAWLDPDEISNWFSSVKLETTSVAPPSCRTFCMRAVSRYTGEKVSELEPVWCLRKCAAKHDRNAGSELDRANVRCRGEEVNKAEAV